MKKNRKSNRNALTITVAIVLAAVLLSVPAKGADFVEMIPSVVKMQSSDRETTEMEPRNLYALSAVLMDGDSGRVLFEKEGYVPRANASTTKVLTCILALENAPGDDYVEVSEAAASQPEVKLGMRKGEQYFLEDLLYSLMLKSHNDSAVAIAEHIAGSVPAFAVMMNEKAKEIGCTDTHFVTPNGLDAKDEGGEHRATARDLALIMRYALKNPAFLHITQTREYHFSDISGKRQFSLTNANRLFDLMDGVLSGKTGFTGNAGYCYVGAVKREEKTFIVALLGCGWPNNKNYKWKDAKALVDYGDANFEYQSIWEEPSLPPVAVKDAVPEQGKEPQVYLTGYCKADEAVRQKKLLLRKDQKIEWKITRKKNLEAPIKKGEKLGEAVCCLDGETILICPILAERRVERIDFSWYVERVFHDYFH